MSDTEAQTAPTLPEHDGSHTVEDVEPTAPAAAATKAPRLTRRGRVRKWDRAPQPHDWRWYVGNVGKTLITTGLLLFAFVGYQLYGTGIETAAAQNRLEDEFAAQLAQFDSAASPEGDVGEQVPVDIEPDGPDFEEVVEDGTTGDSDVVEADPPPPDAEPDDALDEETVEETVDAEPTPPPAEPVVDVVPVAQQNIPDVADGDAVARLEIPAIGRNDIVVAGVATTDLKKGPGHFPDTPLPGQLGNTAIAGHRTTFGQPFRNVDQLVPGDEMRVTTPNGVFVYLVTGTQIVSPADYQVIATSDPTKATITLVSCHPVLSARQRIVIFGELDRTVSSAIGAPVINYGRPDQPVVAEELPGDDLVADAPATVTNDEAPTIVTDDEAAAVDGADDPTATDDETPAIVTDDPTTTDESSSEPTDDALLAESTDGEPAVQAEDPAPTNDIDELGSQQVNAGIADAFSEGWFSEPAANSQVGIWGAVLGVIAIAAYAISRRFRRDLFGLAVGLVPFMLALYFFFQNVNRLLPPNL